VKRCIWFLLILPLAIGCRKPSSAAPPLPAASPQAASATAAETDLAPPPGSTVPGPPPAAKTDLAASPGSTVPGPPPAAKPLPAQLPAVLARVNGESIERWELEQAVRTVEAQAGSAVPPDKRDQVLRGVLDELVAYHLLIQESQARKMAVPEADVIAQLKEVRGGFPDEQKFQQALAAQGLSLEQLRKKTRMTLQIVKIIDTEITPTIKVPDAEVSAFYKSNLARFAQGETVHASHILLAVPQNAAPGLKQQAKAKAEQILKEVRGGGDFAKLARENSQDQGSAANGGDLGFFPKQQMDPAFEAAAFSTKPGAVSGVVETPFGFHVIKVHERRAPRTAPFAEVSDQIKEFLVAQQRDAMVLALVDQLKAKAKVEILV
jgi:peptidyl-prolyl cis-trans isomerase C